MDSQTNPLPESAWLIAASATGAMSVLAFVLWWFSEAGSHCGVVRFYEYLLGTLIAGGWAIGTALGWAMVAVARRKRRKPLLLAGAVCLVLASALALATSAALYYNDLRQNLDLAGEKELLAMLEGESSDQRVLAAHKLGERRAAGAIPRLAAALANREADINLRHNAAIALGAVCTPPQAAGADCGLALAALIDALQDRDEHLPISIAGALGKMGDQAAIPALAFFLMDNSRPPFARQDAAAALAAIGGEKARTALEEAAAHADDQALRERARRLLKAMEREH